MKLLPVVEAIRLRCPSFANRVAGAADFKALPEKANLVVPAAYVIPLDDVPEPQRSQNGYRQTLRDAFAVVVAISNVADERGQAAINAVHDLRAELWKALLGWQIDEAYGPIEYDGGQLLQMDRARLYYQFEFAASVEIVTADTHQAAVLAGSPNFTAMRVQVDAIDPMADPNLKYPGPDGRIETEITLPLPQS